MGSRGNLLLELYPRVSRQITWNEKEDNAVHTVSRNVPPSREYQGVPSDSFVEVTVETTKKTSPVPFIARGKSVYEVRHRKTQMNGISKTVFGNIASHLKSAVKNRQNSGEKMLWYHPFDIV